MNIESGKLDEYKKNITPDDALCATDYVFRESRIYQRCWMCRRNTILTPEALNNYIVELFKYCLTHRVDSYRIHMDRIKGVKVLVKITDRTDYNDLKLAQVVGIIWSSISVAHHFYLRYAADNSGFILWNRKRQYHLSLYAFEKVLTMLLPQLFTTVIEAIVRFLSEAKLWDMEPFIIALLRKLLCVYKNMKSIINYLLDIMDNSTISDARNVLKVLYALLKHITWSEMDEVLMKRLLSLYRMMVDPPAGEGGYWVLKKGVELCMKHILMNMTQEDVQNVIQQLLQWVAVPGIPDILIIDYGSLLEYAATLHDNNSTFTQSISDEVFLLVLDLISSKDILLNLLGTRVLQYLLDKHDNLSMFKTPKIFFQDTHVDIKVAPYNTENKNFLKMYRKVIHMSLVQSIEEHGSNIINLESIYTCIALIIVEVPCGYTAAAIVCLAMAIQESSLLNENLKLECSNRIHAAVLAIMSLVCYVHKAKVFYDYLNIVLGRRARYAPHLNPPLLQAYVYAQHHVMWCKPELFFEDWEARYGLWKCFVTVKSKLFPKFSATKS